MIADSPKPVLRVAEIGFAPMHDSMPIAAREAGNFLTDRMGFVEEVMEQPQAGQTATQVVAVEDRTACGERVDRQAGQLGPGGLVGAAGTEWIQAIGVEQRAACGSVLVGRPGEIGKRGDRGERGFSHALRARQGPGKKTPVPVFRFWSKAAGFPDCNHRSRLSLPPCASRC